MDTADSFGIFRDGDFARLDIKFAPLHELNVDAQGGLSVRFDRERIDFIIETLSAIRMEIDQGRAN